MPQARDQIKRRPRRPRPEPNSRSDAAQGNATRPPRSKPAKPKQRGHASEGGKTLRPKLLRPKKDPKQGRSDAAQGNSTREAEVRGRGKSDAAQGNRTSEANAFKRSKRYRADLTAARRAGVKRSIARGERIIPSSSTATTARNAPDVGKFLLDRVTAPYRYTKEIVERSQDIAEETGESVRKARQEGRSPSSALLKGAAKGGVQAAALSLPIPDPAERGVRAIGDAVIEEPGKTIKNTGGGFKDMATGMPGALLSMAVDTVEGTKEGDPLRGAKRAGSEYVKDVKRRYGPLFKGKEGEKEFKERIKEEGAAAEIVDVAGTVAGPGGAASRGLTAVAKTGRIGEGPKGIVSTPRTKLQTSGKRVREQPLSPGFFRARRQKKKDVKAFEGQQRQIRRADREAAERHAKTGEGPKRGPVDAVVRKATEAGNVVPSRPTLYRDGRKVKVGRAPSKRKLAKSQRVAFGREKGATLQRQKEEQRREGLGGGGRGAARLYASLSKNEKRAYKHAIQAGATTAPALAAAARKRIKLIEENRVDEPAGHDELVTLRQIAAEPEKFMGPGLSAAVRVERERAARVAVDDPRLGDTPEERVGRALTRSALPQAMLLDVKRGGTPIKDAEAAARAGVRRTKAQRSRAGRAVERSERKAGRERGRATLIREQRTRAADDAVARTTRAAEIHERAAANHERRAGSARSAAGREAHEAKAVAARQRADAARERLAGLQGEKRAPKADLGPTPRTGKTGKGDFAGDADLEATWGHLTGDPNATAMRTRKRDDGRQRVSVERYDAEGNLIGRLVFDQGDDGIPKNVDVVVHSAQQRKGVATSLYDRAEAGGFNMRAAESAVRSPEGRAFRTKRDGSTRDTRKGEQAVPPAARAAEARATRAEAAAQEARERREMIRQSVKDAKKRVRDTRAARRQGVKLVDAEPWADFLERVTEAARKEGLESPGFFPSQPRATVRRSVFTSGGFRSVPRDRSYKGTLFKEGREDGSFITYAQALARNLKAKHNWRLVTEAVEEHALPGYRNRGVEELKKQLERDGIDPDSVGFWSPGVFKEAGDAAELDQAARLGDTDLSHPEDIRGVVEEGGAALSESVRLARDTGRFSTSRDWVVVPKGVLDEIEADTNPSGFLGRGIDRAKAVQSKILLGTSPAWIQFQVLANMLQTTLAGVGPMEIVRANRWWKTLTPEERAAVEPYVGVGAFADALDKPRIGSAADNVLVNAWRAFTGADFWHKPRKPMAGAAVSQLNPLDVLFRIDNAQNRAFRRAVLYNRAKRDAYGRMGESMTRMQRTQTRLMGHLGRPPEELDAKLRGILQDRVAIEQHAQAVKDFLGDYITYTARERRTLGRSIMFYGYLRFSLRFAFYTMPVKHPVMSAILLQLGGLQTREVVELLGGRELPWKLGAFYYTVEGEDKPRSINVARMNPLLNTLTELDPRLPAREQARNAVRFLPPIYGALADQIYGASAFTGKDYRTGGAPREEAAGDEGRLRIFFNDMARLNAIYREIDKGMAGGVPQGDDSILGDRPTKYKRADILGGINKTRQDFADQGGAAGSFIRGMAPLVPRPDNAPEVAAKIRELRGEPAAAQAGGPTDPEQKKLLEEARREAKANAPSDEEREKLLQEARAAAQGG